MITVEEIIEIASGERNVARAMSLIEKRLIAILLSCESIEKNFPEIIAYTDKRKYTSSYMCHFSSGVCGLLDLGDIGVISRRHICDDCKSCSFRCRTLKDLIKWGLVKKDISILRTRVASTISSSFTSCIEDEVRGFLFTMVGEEYKEADDFEKVIRNYEDLYDLYATDILFLSEPLRYIDLKMPAKYADDIPYLVLSFLLWAISKREIRYDLDIEISKEQFIEVYEGILNEL